MFFSFFFFLSFFSFLSFFPLSAVRRVDRLLLASGARDGMNGTCMERRKVGVKLMIAIINF